MCYTFVHVAYTEQDKRAALASFDEHHGLMMMINPRAIKEKLVEMDLLPDKRVAKSEQMTVLLNEVKTLISAKGAAKFVDLVEVIITHEQYDELGNHLIGV